MLDFFAGAGRRMRQIEFAWVAQLVERVLGKDEVTGSIPVPGSRVFSFGRPACRQAGPLDRGKLGRG